MDRFENTRLVPWADMTTSALRSKRWEACEKALAGLSCRGLFDKDATDADAETLYDLSCFAAEEKRTGRKEYRLHTIQELRDKVMRQFVAEFAMLSTEEHVLTYRVFLNGGSYRLQNLQEMKPACHLVRRLWCTVEKQDDEWVLSMPHALCGATMLLWEQQAIDDLGKLLDEVEHSVEDSLYLMGVTQLNGPLVHLKSLLKNTIAAPFPHLMERFLDASFDYVLNRQGEKILIHPGLADPEHLMQYYSVHRSFSMLSPEDLAKAVDSMDAIEEPLCERMISAIEEAVRPEIIAEEAAEDLLVLAKQDVSLADMQEVLSSMLIIHPTAEMLEILKEIHEATPRWPGLNASRLQ